MNLYQCQEWAQEHGHDKVKFIALFPAGPQECEWLDAYMGLFRIPAVGDGFLMFRDINQMFPNLVCLPAEVKEPTA